MKYIAKTRVAVFSLVALSLSGCGSLSGVGGNNSFGCKAPQGVTCKSVSGVYYNTLDENTQREREKENAPKNAPKKDESRYYEPGAQSNKPRAVKASLSGSETEQDKINMVPARSSTRELRIWFAPWLDNDGAAHDESYVYVVVEEGRWLLQRKLDLIRERYAPSKTTGKTAQNENH